MVSSSSWPVGIVPCPLVLLQVQTCSAVQSMRLELRILLPPSFSPGAWVLGTPALLRPRGEGGLCQAACSAGHRPGRCFCLYSRLVAWLPDVPADLQWMQGLLRSLALEVYSRTKDQLLRLVG